MEAQPRRVTSGTIAILGPGGVGGFLAAALVRAGERVTVVASEHTAAAIAADGIALESVSLGDFTARPLATTELAHPAQVLFVSTKATTLEAALGRVRAEPELIVPLLNGLDHMRVLRAWFPPGRIAAGTIRIESERVAPGRIVQSSPSSRVELAADPAAARDALPGLAARLERAGIPATIGASEAQILWSKLVRLCSLALTTSASNEPIGFVRSDQRWAATLAACVSEAAAVAAADGAEVDPAGALGELAAAHPELGSSMRRDLAAGREPELDAIAGSVLRAGARHRLDCPTIARLSDQVARAARLRRRAGTVGWR